MSSEGGKIFNDPIHGHIEVSNICVKIIDTPQYQRLRDISQLGGLYYVFSGASSNRFEHCIGVSHLAKMFVEKLRLQQPELNITEADVLCVELAGLLHDLGHGPFSHMFDMKFLKQMGTAPNGFEHEHASIAIFDLLIEENNLMTHFYDSGLNKDDIHFIKELILGDESEVPNGFKWKGRGEKTFLYDIVANKRNGIDVDKFDYFARDCHVLGLSKSFDCLRLMRFARVLKVNRNKDGYIVMDSPTDDSQPETCSQDPDAAGNLEICFHIKEAWNLFELFHTRYALHKRAYQHKVSMAVEMMICESMVKADPYIFIPGRVVDSSISGRISDTPTRVPTRMSQTPHDMHAYWRCSDYIWKRIQFSTEKELQPARDIIHRVMTRDLYVCAGESLLTPEYALILKNLGSKVALDHIACNLVTMVEEMQGVAASNRNGVAASIDSEAASPSKKSKTFVDSKSFNTKVTVNDITCSFVKMGYGKGGKNPVSELTTFYLPPKAGSNGSMIVGLAPSESVSRLLPREFEEIYLRIYCKHKAHLPVIKAAFEQWCKLQAKLHQDTIASAQLLKAPDSPKVHVKEVAHVTTPTISRKRSFREAV